MNKFSKVSTEDLEKKIFGASPDDKALIAEVLAEREAKADFGAEPVKENKVKTTKTKVKADAAPKKVKKAAPKKAAPKKAVAKKASPKKAAVKKPRVSASAPKEKAAIMGKKVSFHEHLSDNKVQGTVVRCVTGTDGKPYVGIRVGEKIRFKQLQYVTILK